MLFRRTTRQTLQDLTGLEQAVTRTFMGQHGDQEIKFALVCLKKGTTCSVLTSIPPDVLLIHKTAPRNRYFKKHQHQQCFLAMRAKRRLRRFQHAKTARTEGIVLISNEIISQSCPPFACMLIHPKLHPGSLSFSELVWKSKGYAIRVMKWDESESYTA